MAANKECKNCLMLGKLLEQSEQHKMDLIHIIQQNVEILGNRNKDLVELISGQKVSYEQPPVPTKVPPKRWSQRRKEIESEDRRQHLENVRAITEKAEQDAGLK